MSLYFDKATGIPVATTNSTTKQRTQQGDTMDINELKAAVKEAADESVGLKLAEFGDRLDGMEARLDALQNAKAGKSDDEVNEAVSKALKAAGFIAGSQQVDEDFDTGRKSASAYDDRRDAFGRTVKRGDTSAAS